jgi:hypothetical protein
MVRDTCKIERSNNLNVVAERMLDWLALEIFIGIARTCDPVAEGPGVKRPAGVNVRLAEIGIAERVALGEHGRGDQADQNQGDPRQSKVPCRPQERGGGRDSRGR